MTFCLVSYQAGLICRHPVVTLYDSQDNLPLGIIDAEVGSRNLHQQGNRCGTHCLFMIKWLILRVSCKRPQQVLNGSQHGAGLITVPAGVINTLIEFSKKLVQQRVVDRLVCLIVRKITFRNIGFVVCIVNQHMIPGLVLWRPTPGNLVIPFIGSQEFGVNVHNDSPVIEYPVLDALPDRKLSLLHAEPKTLVIKPTFY